MASSLTDIVKDPNYIHANDETKQAIFDKHSASDPNYTNANDETKQAIREKFGLKTSSDYGRTQLQTIGDKAYSFGTGLVKSTLGQAGEMEKMGTPDNPIQKAIHDANPILAPLSIAKAITGKKTALPTEEDIKTDLEKFGLPKSKERGYETAGAIAPAVLGVGKGLYDFGKYGIKKLSDIKDIKDIQKEMGKQLQTGVKNVDSQLQKSQSELSKAGQSQEQLSSRSNVAGEREAFRNQHIENSLSQISPKVERPILDEDVVSLLQRQGSDNLSKLKDLRREKAITEIRDPAFQKIIEKEKLNDFIATNPNSKQAFNEVVDELNHQISRALPEHRPALTKRLNTIKGIQTVTNDKGQLVQVQGKPLTLDQVEDMVRILKDKKIWEVEGAAGIDVSRMNKVADKLSEAATNYEPDYAKYKKVYADWSNKIRKVTAGKGEGATSIDFKDPEEVIFSANKKGLAGYYLNGSQEGAQAMVNLVGGKTPELMNKIKGFVRSELESKKTAQAAYEFTKKNEGLFRVFPELRPQVNAVVTNMSEAEKLTKASGENAKFAEKRLAGSETKLKAQIAPKERVLSDLNRLKTDLATEHDSLKIQTIASNSAKQLYDNKAISLKEYDALKTRLNDVAKKTKDEAELKKKVTYLLYWAGAGYGMAQLGGHIIP